MPSGSSAKSSNVLARNRTWSTTFAGSRAHPSHSEDSLVKKCPAEELNLVWQFRGLPCDPAHPQGISNQYPDLESNQDLDLRRVRCDPLHHRDNRKDEG